MSHRERTGSEAPGGFRPSPLWQRKVSATATATAGNPRTYSIRWSEVRRDQNLLYPLGHEGFGFIGGIGVGQIGYIDGACRT